jgi:hypothetical protein
MYINLDKEKWIPNKGTIKVVKTLFKIKKLELFQNK